MAREQVINSAATWRYMLKSKLYRNVYLYDWDIKEVIYSYKLGNGYKLFLCDK